WGRVHLPDYAITRLPDYPITLPDYPITLPDYQITRSPRQSPVDDPQENPLKSCGRSTGMVARLRLALRERLASSKGRATGKARATKVWPRTNRRFCRGPSI